MKLIRRERKSKFIQKFEPPKGGGGHGICPAFHKLTPGIGCPYSCLYCYLDKTLRSMEPGSGDRRYEVYTNAEKMRDEVLRWLDEGQHDEGNEVLNAGEVLDSLATPEIKRNIEYVINTTRDCWGDNTLLLLTKSTNIPDCKPSDNVILSWSIGNSDMVEIGAPPRTERLYAAMYARSMGWRVRLRIDPILIGWNHLTDQWERTPEPDLRLFGYINQIDPERVTLGTQRYQGKPLLSAKARIAVYKWYIRGLECTVGLCKETPEIYSALGINTENIKCNCTP